MKNAGSFDDVPAARGHGGQLPAAEHLLDHGAALNWLPGWEQLTPLDAAARSAATDVITWLYSPSANTSSELRDD